MSLTQVFSWNDLTWWAAGNPLAAPAHSLILLTGLKDQSNGAAVAHALWRFYAWNFHKHVSVLQSESLRLSSVYLVIPVEGGGAGHTCGPAPQFSLFVCAFILKGNLSSRLHTNTGSPSDTLTPCGNSSTLWRTHATTRHRAQRCTAAQKIPLLSERSFIYIPLWSLLWIFILFISCFSSISFAIFYFNWVFFTVLILCFLFFLFN